MTKELTKDDFYSILQGKLILDESGSLKSSKNIKISLYFFKKKFEFLDLLGVYKKTMGDWILKLIRGDYNLKIEDFYI